MMPLPDRDPGEGHTERARARMTGIAALPCRRFCSPLSLCALLHVTQLRFVFGTCPSSDRNTLMPVFAAPRTVWSSNFHAQVELAQVPRPHRVVHIFYKGRMATRSWRASPWARGGAHPVTNCHGTMLLIASSPDASPFGGLCPSAEPHVQVISPVMVGGQSVPKHMLPWKFRLTLTPDISGSFTTRPG